MNILKLKRANRYLRIAYRYRYIRFQRTLIRNKKKKSPQLFHPVDSELERKHKALYSRLYKPIDLSFLRYACHLSGKPDHRYVPSGVHKTIVMRIMNNLDYFRLVADKNLLDRIVGAENTVKVYLRKIREGFYDPEYQAINYRQAKARFDQLSHDIIVKPSLSSSGKNVRLLKWHKNGFKNESGRNISFSALDDLYKSDYLIQEHIKQHSFLSKLNPGCVLTVRASTYRSVLNEEPVVLQTYLKIAKQDSVVDNLYRGAIGVWTDLQGRLNDFGLNNQHEKFYALPETDMPFAGMKIPHFENIVDMAKLAAIKIPTQRMLNLDFALREDTRACLIDINCVKSNLFAQLMGTPHFREYTNEIVDYCASNRNKEHFNMIKTLIN